MSTGKPQRLPEREATPSFISDHRRALLRRIGGEPPEDPLLDGKLRLVRRLGKGGMGTVWEAEHTGLGTRVAVKRMQRELAGQERFRLRFLREARAAASVEHPHVVAIFDVASDDEQRPYIVMELLEGEPLSDVLRRDGPMPWARVRTILTQLAGALRHAHACGVVHRDLKPGNIVVLGAGTDEEAVKIIDFGLAKQRSLDPQACDITHTGEVFGSPGYMSPEQLRTETIDARADIYALGCIAFELLTGRKPFGGPTVADMVVQHLTLAPPSPAPIDAPEAMVPAIQALVRRALAKEPAERHQDAAEFADELSAIGTARPLFRSGRTKRAAIAGGVVALVGLGWLAWSGFDGTASQAASSEEVSGEVAPPPEPSTPPPEPSTPAETSPKDDAPAPFTREFERPVDRPTPAWPTRWLGAELGLSEPRRDPQAPDRTGSSVPAGMVGIWGASPSEPTPHRWLTPRDDVHRLSRHAVAQGLTLGHSVEDPERVEKTGRTADPSTGRVFWTDPRGFPWDAIGTTLVGPGCVGVQVGPVHVLTSAQCVWAEGGFVMDDRRWQPGVDREGENSVPFIRVYVPQEWPQNDRAGLFDWAVAITERRLGERWFGVTALPDEALGSAPMYHKGYPLEHDEICDSRSPGRWADGANRPWGSPEPLVMSARGLRAPSPISGWARVLATAQVPSTGHAGGPYYFYDATDRPVAMALHRSACSDVDGGSPDFCGWTGAWDCDVQAALPSQATRLEPDALYGHVLPVMTWWGVDDEGRAVCLLESGC